MRTKRNFQRVLFLLLLFGLLSPGKECFLLQPRSQAFAFVGDNLKSPDSPPLSPGMNSAESFSLPKDTTLVTEKVSAAEAARSSERTSEYLNLPLPDQPTPAFTSTATVSATSPGAEETLAAPSLDSIPVPEPSPAQEKTSTTEAPPVPPASGGIIFNFDNADIHEVISTVADLLGINYTVDPKVAGTVNIHTTGEISKKDLYSVFETVLRLAGATIIKKGDFYHIIPVADASKDYIIPELGRSGVEISPSDAFIIQVVPLRYVAAKEMVNIVKPFMSQFGTTADKDAVLILYDSAANMKKLLTLVDLFDVDIFEQLHLKLYEVQKADTEELAFELEDIFKVIMPKEADVRSGGISVLSLPRVKLILAVSSSESLLEKALQWAKQLDSEASETEVKIFVYYVQNSKAMDLADVLGQVFETQAGMGYGYTQQTTFQSRLREQGTSGSMLDRQSGRTSRQTQTQQQETQRLQQQQQASQGARTARAPRTQGAYGGAYGQQAGPKILGEEVAIVVDEMNNALIIRATEKDYRKIEKTIKQLDIYPKQVLIEVLIAEIRLDDESKMGVEWEYMNDIGEKTTYDIRGTGIDVLEEEISKGLYYMVAKTDRFQATLRAFASKDKVNILSSPHVIAADNKEATIKVTEEIPIVSGQVSTTTDTPVITETTEYRDTGIILSVIPHINDSGLVTLEISQEVSEQSTRTATGSSNPIFLKRAAETSMAVQDGQSVIIGGLIKETLAKGKSGIPILSSIPVMGALFGYHKKTVNRSELMLLLTPHVITKGTEADEITQAFKDKLDILTGTERTLRSKKSD